MPNHIIHNQNDCIHLYKTLMFLCMLKIKFIIPFFHLKNPAIYWLTTFWPITGDPEIWQIWDWFWNISNNISFHFRLFPRKTNDKIFQKIRKIYFGAIWTKTKFPAKNGFVKYFSNITIIYQREKNQKKLMCHSWGKWWTDRWMNRRKDRQTTVIIQDSLWDGCPIIKVALIFPEFISKHQKPVYSINFSVRYSQF